MIQLVKDKTMSDIYNDEIIVGYCGSLVFNHPCPKCNCDNIEIAIKSKQGDDETPCLIIYCRLCSSTFPID
jgi:hypothetical protein